MKYSRLFLISFLTILYLHSFCKNGQKSSESNAVFQSARSIPVVRSVDIVIVGGTVAAVSAAVSASQQGAKVFLVAPRPYLGEDINSTLRLAIDKERVLKSDLEKKLFKGKLTLTPLRVKSILDSSLLAAGVISVFGSFATDVIRDNNNKLSGIVISNRAGRQAILAKVIIDATDRAWLCRIAGAKAEKWKGSEITFERTVIKSAEGKNNNKFTTERFKVPMTALHFADFAKAEQVARDKTYSVNQLRASESLFSIPPDPIICKKNSKEWNDLNPFDVRHFIPSGLDRIYVLSGSAGIPRETAEMLLQPGAMTELGSLIGIAAASEAGKVVLGEYLSVKSDFSKTIVTSKGDIKENLVGLRPSDHLSTSVPMPLSKVPVSGEYDVIVIGGGTSGAPAAIAAARSGMSVLVVEYQEGLGGVGTLGLIGKAYNGRRVGFAAEVPFPSGNIESKMEWYRSEIIKAGGDIWFGAIGCGAYVERKQVKGVVVCTPEGRSVVLAGVVIDATGNGDIPVSAGAKYMYGEIENNDIALQGTGLPSRPLQGNYQNSDYLLVDETDMIDVWRTLVSVHAAKSRENDFDAGSLIQNRERRRIVGDFVMTYLDQISGRTYPDAIVLSGSDYDSHGYPSSPYFALLPHDEVSKKKNHPAPGGTCYTPYRCLLPKGLDGILVIGLGISMDRDASAKVRMQFDMANQGYAAGIAATMAVTSGVQPREINVRKLQHILIEKGNIPGEVLKFNDSFPIPDKEIALAVSDYAKATNPEMASKSLAIILTHQQKAVPLISQYYQKSSGRQKLLYAQLLGINGKKEGLPTLIEELNKIGKWDNKIFQGYMADYAHLPTPMDAIILSIGFTGDRSASPCLIELINRLDSSVTLSHHRSVALAIEKIKDPAAAPALARLLKKPGMMGHAMTAMEQVFLEVANDGIQSNGSKEPFQKRTRALREIVLARALYNCGDFENLGKTILENYTNDMQGLFAQHAIKELTK